MTRLLLYHDFSSPFCRVALDVALEAAEALEAELRALPFELHPEPHPLPAPGDPALAAEVQAALPAAGERGIRLEGLARTPRTRKAHEAVAHARTRGLELPMLRALYEALWRDGRDIGRIDVLADVGQTAGLERDALHVALGVDAYRDEVAEAQRQAEAEGITGVPSLRLGDRVLVGLVATPELLRWARGPAA